MSSTALYKFSSSFGTGTWNFNNSLGFLFTTFSDTVLTHLGIFDSAGDGITSTITVRVYVGSTSTVVTSITFNGDGVLENGFRYKALASPITLPALTAYTIAGGAYNTPNTGWQTGDGGSWSEAQIGGRVLSGVAVTGPADAIPSAQFPKFTKVGVSFKGRDEGALPSAELLFEATIQGTYESTATLPITLSGTAEAQLTLGGSATLPITVSGTAVMQGIVYGSATGQINLTGTAESGSYEAGNATGTITFSGNALLTAIGILTSSGTITLSGTASVDGSGGMQAQGGIVLTGSADIGGQGNLEASGAILMTATAYLEAISSDLAFFVITVGGEVTAGGSTSLEATIDIELTGQANIGGSVNVSLQEASIYLLGSASVDTPPLYATGTIYLGMSGAISGVADGLSAEFLMTLTGTAETSNNLGQMSATGTLYFAEGSEANLTSTTPPDPTPASCGATVPVNPVFGYHTTNGSNVRKRFLEKVGGFLLECEFYYTFLKCGTSYTVHCQIVGYTSMGGDVLSAGIWRADYAISGLPFGPTVNAYISIYCDERLVSRIYAGAIPIFGGSVAGTLWVVVPPVGSGIDILPQQEAGLLAALQDPTKYRYKKTQYNGSYRTRCLAWEIFDPRSGWSEWRAERFCTNINLNGIMTQTDTISSGTDFYVLKADCLYQANVSNPFRSDGMGQFTANALTCTHTQAFTLGTDVPTGLPINPGMDSNSAQGFSNSIVDAGWGTLVSQPPAGGFYDFSRIALLTSIHHPTQTLRFKLKKMDWVENQLSTKPMEATIIGIDATNATIDGVVQEVTTNDQNTDVTFGGSYIQVTGSGFTAITTKSTSYQTPPSSWYVKNKNEGQVYNTKSTTPPVRTYGWKTRLFNKWSPLKLVESRSVFVDGSPWQVSEPAVTAGQWNGSFGGTTVSLASSKLRVVNTFGLSTAFAAKFFSDGSGGISLRGLEGRYLNFRFRSTGLANQTFNVFLPGLRFANFPTVNKTIYGVVRSGILIQLTTGAVGTWVDKTIDLLMVNQMEETPTYWQVDDDSYLSGLVVYPPISPSVGIELEYIKSEKVGNSRITTLSPAPSETLASYFLANSPFGYPDKLVQYNSQIMGWCGGVRSLSPHVFVPIPGKTTPFVYGSIGQLIDNLNRVNLRTNPTILYPNTLEEPKLHRGLSMWTATDLTPPRVGKPYTVTTGVADPGGTTFPWAYDDLYDSDPSTHSLGGDGIMATPSNTTVQKDLMVDPVNGLELEAQHVIGEFKIYPGIGNFGGRGEVPTTYSNLSEVWVYYLAGSQIVGCLIDEDGDATLEQYLEDVGAGMVESPTPVNRGGFETLEDSDRFSVGNQVIFGRIFKNLGVGLIGESFIRKYGNRFTDTTPKYESPTPVSGTFLKPSIEPVDRQRWLARVYAGDKDLLCYNMTGEQRHHAYYVATNGDLRLIRVFQEVSGVIGAAPSVGTSRDTLIQAGHYSYPNAMELSGMYSSSELGDLRHGAGTHAVGAINKDTGHIQLFVSTDRGEAWRVETLSQTYSALQMVEHRGRIIATGWNGGSWYAFVGTPRAYTGVAGSGEYEWSNTSGLGTLVVATTKKSGRLWVSEAGVINFAYMDNSGTPKILRCSSISKTGSGTWD